MITNYTIRNGKEVLKTCQDYNIAIHWLYQNREYELIGVRTDYTHDIPSEKVVTFKVLRRRF